MCEQWCDIKWFFEHMAKLHNVKYCRTCREYLPIPEQKLHMKFHAQPEYFKQKILIKNGQPIKINRKQRASLTPIGKLSHWRTGGQVVKVDSNFKSSIKDFIVGYLLLLLVRKSCMFFKVIFTFYSY